MASVQDTLLKMAERLKIIERKLREPSPDSMGGYWTPMLPWTVLPGLSVTATTNNMYFLSVPRTMTIRKLVLPTYTLAPNNVSNYWSFQFTPGSAVSILSGVDFHLDTAAVWQSHVYTTFDNPEVLIGDIYIVGSVTKVGAPGALYLGTPMILFT